MAGENIPSHIDIHEITFCRGSDYEALIMNALYTSAYIQTNVTHGDLNGNL